MRGARAKEIRRAVYGDLSLKSRRYFRAANGQIVREKRRRVYQAAKRGRLLVPEKPTSPPSGPAPSPPPSRGPER